MGRNGELILGEVREGVCERHGGIIGRWIEPHDPGLVPGFFGGEAMRGEVCVKVYVAPFRK
jgi:hypothetical protein